MAVNAIMSDLVGNGEFLKTLARNVCSVHDSELITRFYQHSGNAGDGIGALPGQKFPFASPNLRDRRAALRFSFLAGQDWRIPPPAIFLRVGALRSLIIPFLLTALEQHFN